MTVPAARAEMVVESFEGALSAGSLTFRDDWLSDAALAADCATARRLAGPGTSLFAVEVAGEAAQAYDGAGGPLSGFATMAAWAGDLFTDDARWDHFGDGVLDGLRWSCWASIELAHSGILLIQDDATGDIAVRVVDTN